MLLLTDAMPIQLETLDANERTLSCVAATLTHLYQEEARATLCANSRPAGLRWGARVRFQIGEAPQRYVISGSVIGWENQEAGEDEPPYACELRLRIWECHVAPQRRQLPRRASRIAVQFRPWTATESDESPEQEGWCVDIGAGGMRFRVRAAADSLPERLHLRFRLPSAEPGQRPALREFRLCGRVLRTEPAASARGVQEVAARFERIPVADGMALARYLETLEAASLLK